MKKLITINNLIARLLNIARNGMVQYYNPATNLFDFIVTDDSIKKEKRQLLLTHSLISLLGVSWHKGAASLNYKASLDVLNEKLINEKKIGREHFLLLWLLAKENDSRAETVFSLVKNIDHDQIHAVETMEVAWLLIALLFEAKRRGDKDVVSEVDSIANFLKKRFLTKTGFFLHTPQPSGNYSLRYNIANFADQIYSIYAFAMYALIMNDVKFLEIANQCAKTICAVQGELGQWWWHYNALTGEVIQKYPVFSVHQDSMAPFALMALTEVSKHDYMPNVIKGLQWVFGKNELNAVMINRQRCFVRRGIERKWPLSKIQNVVTIATNSGLMCGIDKKYDQPEYLKIMDWEYSYHLGWILYAYNEKNKHLWHKI